MAHEERSAHPYIPNSAAAVRAEMLAAVGVPDPESIYCEVIPDHLRLQRPLDLPEPFRSELDLRRHVEDLLARNTSCREASSFLGAGCWDHYVPAVCDEVNGRGELLTAYGGHWYSDHGKFQAYFEFQSMLGELLDMDAVSLLTYDWASALSSALLMATRITERPQVLIPRNLDPEKLAHLQNFAQPAAEIDVVGFHRSTGSLDLEELGAALSSRTAAVYVEQPTYLGTLETQLGEIAGLAHEAGALLVMGVDPVSLGILEPPGGFDADLVCGEVQPLGIHMQYGGGLGGFLAGRDDPRHLVEYPTLLTSIVRTAEEGRLGYAWANWEETSWVKRELSRDFTGTTTNLWAITAGVYLALMGPQGMRELGETILGKSQFARRLLAGVDGVRLPLAAPSFKEFVVNIDPSGRTVSELNEGLLQRGIFGGKDLSTEFPELGQSSLFCVTEMHSQREIERLASAIGEVLR